MVDEKWGNILLSKSRYGCNLAECELPLAGSMLWLACFVCYVCIWDPLAGVMSGRKVEAGRVDGGLRVDIVEWLSLSISLGRPRRLERFRRSAWDYRGGLLNGNDTALHRGLEHHRTGSHIQMRSLAERSDTQTRNEEGTEEEKENFVAVVRGQRSTSHTVAVEVDVVVGAQVQVWDAVDAVVQWCSGGFWSS